MKECFSVSNSIFDVLLRCLLLSMQRVGVATSHWRNYWYASRTSAKVPGDCILQRHRLWYPRLKFIPGDHISTMHIFRADFILRRFTPDLRSFGVLYLCITRIFDTIRQLPDFAIVPTYHLRTSLRYASISTFDHCWILVMSLSSLNDTQSIITVGWCYSAFHGLQNTEAFLPYITLPYNTSLFEILIINENLLIW